MITKNVGTADKVVRVVVGAGLAFAAYKASGALAVILGVLAAGAIITALTGWCGLYTLLGISTACAACGTDKPPSAPENKPQ